MPRLTTSLPKYSRHRATGQAVVTLCGRDHYLGPYKSKASRIEYDRLVGEWVAAGRPASLRSFGDGITVAELISAYWRFAKGYYVKNGKPSGSIPNVRIALRLLKENYARTAAADFGPLALKAIRQKMIDAGKSRVYINNCIDFIRRVFKWAVAEEMVPPSVHQALSAVPGLRRGRSAARETPPVRPVPEAIVAATLPHLPRVVADMVRFQLLTGCRPNEVCNLRPSDVDTSKEIWEYRPSTHKTEHHGRERVILVGPQGQAILRPYLERETSAYCFSPADSEKQRREEAHAHRNTPLSCGNRPGTNRERRPKRPAGVQYTTASYRRALDRAAIAAAVEKWSPNRLRHSAATRIRATFDIEAAQIILGHSKPDTTQIYAERNLAKAAEVMRQVG